MMDLLTQKIGANGIGTAADETIEAETDEASRSFPVSAFEARGCQYVLKAPTTCYARFTQGYYEFECPEYAVEGYAQSRQEAYAELNADFACRYEGLVNEPDETLTLDAIEARDHLRESVQRVEIKDAVTAI